MKMLSISLANDDGGQKIEVPVRSEEQYPVEEVIKFFIENGCWVKVVYELDRKEKTK